LFSRDNTDTQRWIGFEERSARGLRSWGKGVIEGQPTGGGISRTIRSALLQHIVWHTKEYLGIKGINNFLGTKMQKKEGGQLGR
jgi:hypothetical protein